MTPGQLTQVLARVREGDRAAEAELLATAYHELRNLAARQLKGTPDPLLQPTMLVHELFLRLNNRDSIEPHDPTWRSRGHFMAVAATAMRQIVIDHLRKAGTAKRGGDLARVSLADVAPQDEASPVDMLALSDALDKLALLDPKQARLVELKVFGGLAHAEAAEVLGMSLRTVEREWRKVRAWLARELALAVTP